MNEDYESDSFVGTNGDSFCHNAKTLSLDEEEKMTQQNSRLVTRFNAQLLETNAKKHWDLFYKRNETKFFRDRHWTTREFVELTAGLEIRQTERPVLIEIGCGVGNLVFPLIDEGWGKYFFYACDFSPRAIEFVKGNKLYDENKIRAFQADITTSDIFEHVACETVDAATMVFVLSAIHPDKFRICLRNVFALLKPGGVVLFRDYGRFDMAQIRFKAGHKISDNFYMRQDGTRSYFFSEVELEELFTSEGFEVITNSYIHRRTVNLKEKIDVPRIFVQAKFRRPLP